jgi:hypothetical protein
VKKKKKRATNEDWSQSATLCTDCGTPINPLFEEYKLRRNSAEHTWEPICMLCWEKMVRAHGGLYGDIVMDRDTGKLKSEIKEVPH